MLSRRVKLCFYVQLDLRVFDVQLLAVYMAFAKLLPSSKLIWLQHCIEQQIVDVSSKSTINI